MNHWQDPAEEEGCGGSIDGRPQTPEADTKTADQLLAELKETTATRMRAEGYTEEEITAFVAKFDEPDGLYEIVPSDDPSVSHLFTDEVRERARRVREAVIASSTAPEAIIVEPVDTQESPFDEGGEEGYGGSIGGRPQDAGTDDS